MQKVSVLLSRPIDARASLAPLGRNGDDLLDRFDGATLVRTIRLAPDGVLVPYAIEIPGEPTDRLEARLPDGASDHAATAIAATFVTETAALAELTERDQAVEGLAARFPGLVPVLYPDPFHALVRSISAQQINLRFALHYGERLTVGDQFVHVLDAEALRRGVPRICGHCSSRTRRRARSSRPRAPQRPESCAAPIWCRWTTSR